MPPTVCSEKKVHVAVMKESRRRGSMGVSRSNTNTNTVAGVAQSSTVLSYVAKGSMNLAGRRQRRRVARLLTRMEQISTPSEFEMKQRVGMETDTDDSGDNNESTIQTSRTHSSSSNNIETVLQPTTANSNNKNSHSCNIYSGNNKTSTTANLCDQIPSEDDDDDDDDDDDEEQDQESDSGYEFELEPVKQPASLQQYHTNSEGLLSIALKTLKLVQRNKLLQKRLAQLQLETSEFIASVLANPENRHFRDKATVKADAPNKVTNVLLRH
ncbi:WD repeat-containing protein 48 homolog [Drosophila innubila]|uniref:WD repeat-containing protein 48 homolog n=1 Tax=Drosophila innubila TaxID=198719 RepID=UPI00148C34A6|nr:WD repeat-containing protein 48 homolog [Drosophila innubila]